jgi:hypothetical protein
MLSPRACNRGVLKTRANLPATLSLKIVPTRTYSALEMSDRSPIGECRFIGWTTRGARGVGEPRVQWGLKWHSWNFRSTPLLSPS